MVGRFDVKIGDVPVGTVSVEKQGLYYYFSCRCRLSGRGMHRLVVSCGGTKADLGICVPLEGVFGLDKRLPCKRFSPGKPEFALIPRGNQGKFVPVYPEEPFAYMSKLKDAFLEIRDGQAGIVITE